MVAIFYNATKEKFLNANDSYLLTTSLKRDHTFACKNFLQIFQINQKFIAISFFFRSQNDLGSI